MFEHVTVSGGHLNTNFGQGTRLPNQVTRSAGHVSNEWRNTFVVEILQEIDAGYFP